MERIKEALRRAAVERFESPKNTTLGNNVRLASTDTPELECRQSKVVEISTDRLIQNRVISVDPTHRAAVAYKILRTQVLRRMEAHGWNRLAVTSAVPSEGKSLTAVNLAISIAQQIDNNVLLVDLDLRRPSISSFFDHQSTKGLTDYLLKGTALQEILFSPGIEHLLVLPAVAPDPTSFELASLPKLRAFMEELRESFPDYLVIFDFPPILVGDDVLTLSRDVDCVLLVIEDGKTRPDELIRAAELLGETHIIGSVLNKCKIAKLTYYHNYY